MIVSDALRVCSDCIHFELKEADTFFCRLHDIVYNNNQESCEDFEEKEDGESTTYECD